MHVSSAPPPQQHRLQGTFQHVRPPKSRSEVCGATVAEAFGTPLSWAGVEHPPWTTRAVTHPDQRTHEDPSRVLAELAPKDARAEDLEPGPLPTLASYPASRLPHGRMHHLQAPNRLSPAPHSRSIYLAATSATAKA